MLRGLAVFFSYVFHPLLILTYMLLLLLLVNPYQFGVYSFVEQWKLVILVFLSTFLLPMIAVAVMSALGMVKSMQLEARQDRIGPYIIAGVFYLWMFINFKNNQGIPFSLTVATLGASLGLFVVFFFNNFSKISAHAAGVGGLTGLSAINTFQFSFDTFTVHTWFLGTFEVSTTFALMVAILLSGVVCSSRILLEAHKPFQVYTGYAIGFITQFIALWILQ